jgi:FkbM family methyltransferase
MSFISYAQNNEDVLLWRALGHVAPADGFYIDVGANDPVEHSVTKAFYDAGWRGINIEPLPVHIAAFDEQRTRDVNLAIAAGSSDGSLTLYDVPAVRGWASPEPGVAELHRAEGHAVAELTVPVRTLASVCARHVDGPIHFLKIDVEGFEGEVLRGMDFARWRPWVLVIEATLPNSRTTNHDTWEHLVTGHGYRFAWFDGLNRYYVAAEQAALLDHFGIQPNVFDDYIPYHLDRAWDATRRTEAALQASDRHLQRARVDLDDTLRQVDALEHEKRAVQAEVVQAHAEIAHAHAEIDRARAEIEQAQAEIAVLRHDLQQAVTAGQQVTLWAQDLEQRLVATMNSTSWTVTRPLRQAGAVVTLLRRPQLMRRAIGRVTSSNRMRRTLIPLMLRYPLLGKGMSRVLQTVKQQPEQAPEGIPVSDELKGLPVSVRGVLADLRAIRNKQRADS